MGEAVPFWDSRDEFGDTNLLVAKPEEGASLARALGPHWIVLMRRHGATVAGRSLEELAFRTIYTARNAALQIEAHMLGHVGALNAQETRLAGGHNLGAGPVMRAWEYWSVRLDKAEGNFRPRAKAAAKKPSAKRKRQAQGAAKMTGSSDVRGMIAVDKIGCKILFINPQTYQTETVIEGFQRTVHELLVMPESGLAYVPIFGDGIHGRNPNPGHTLHVIDLDQAQALRRHRSVALRGAAHRAARRRRADLHHLRKQRQGRGDRSEDQQSDRRDRFRLDQRPPPLHPQ